ncbi:MAG: response regulator [Gammaproteobacteria bacterium]|nr:MAG: response regulator [Gammaproteobacteria bacterium]
MSTQGTVHVVDDDPAIRNALTASLELRGLVVENYESAEDFLRSYQDNKIGCLVLDISMSGINGLELQEILAEKNHNIPIIFVSGHGDVPMSVQALKNGAIDFLEKPYRQEILHDRIEQALDQSKILRQKSAELASYNERINRLSPREKQVLAMLATDNANTSNKKIAEALDISHRTVEDHRAKIMLKMQANSLYELITMVKSASSVQLKPQNT